MIEIKAPQPVPIFPFPKKLLFLAGSSEMDTAEQWQERVVHALADTNVTILNPRRDDWDASWVQSIENEKFVEQVEWELEGMERAWQIVMYFSPGTKSPITLLELGLYANDGRLAVCCPDGFWRKGHVEVVCRRYGVRLYPSLDSLIEELKSDRSLS